jgi:Na+-transporting NADH:ubiquinone oxidoreductase subunit A
METLASPATVALAPEHIPFLKPRLAVKKGDRVAVGDLICTDKDNPRLRLLSPGGGQVTDIRYGPRRVLREVVIRRDAENEAMQSLAAPLSPEAIDQIPRADLVERLLAGGVWPFLRALPYRGIADPERNPPAIFVSLAASEPFQVPPERYMEGQRERFALGLRALKRLCPDVLVHADSAERSFCEAHRDLITHTVRGRYPADDAGVVLYHLRRSSAENTSWFIKGQDLLLLAQLLQTGQYPTQRVFAVGGSGASRPRYVTSRVGAPLKHLAGEVRCPAPRFAVGGTLRGYTAEADGHMGFYDTALVILPEAMEADFLTSFRPGTDKPTYSRSFLSALRRVPLPMTTNVNGGRRACIACGYCADVCPVEIWPQMTFKSILAGEVEEYLAHGLLDCVECGLCSYVCPSKIELATMLQAAKHAYRKEQV